MIFQYSSGNDGQVLYDINHLQSLVLTNNNLEAFRNTWTMVLSELANPPDPASMQFWYAKQIETFKPMAEDFNHYRRAKFRDSGDHTFEWPWAAGCRHLAEGRERYMQNELNRTLSGRPNGTALAGVEHQPRNRKPKGNPKGKKDRSRSDSRGRKAPKGKKRRRPWRLARPIG